MQVYDQLLLGMGVSLAIAAVGGLLLGPVGVLPIVGAVALLAVALTRFAPRSEPLVGQKEDRIATQSEAPEPIAD